MNQVYCPECGSTHYDINYQCEVCGHPVRIHTIDDTSEEAKEKHAEYTRKIDSFQKEIDQLKLDQLKARKKPFKNDLMHYDWCAWCADIDLYKYLQSDK